jgi:putative addiction module CopG family antidote
MKVLLPKELEDYVAARVQSGEFSSATEVVLDALRSHQRLQVERELEAGISEGRRQVLAGAVTEATAAFFEEARERIRRRAR